MNRIIALAATLAACTVNANANACSSDAWTLMRDNTNAGAKVALVTFDSTRTDGETYTGMTPRSSHNLRNCWNAAVALMGNKPARFHWCEQGRAQ